MLQDYRNSGGKGKTRNLTDTKVGRPRNADFNGGVTVGINITDDVKKLFKIAINKYYRKSNKFSVMETYREMLKDFYADCFIESGERRYSIWAESRIPTYEQFYYWFKKFEDPRKDVISRYGSKEFNLKNRELLSNSTIETDGPGSRFQIDATIADIYLVSSLDTNRIIGRPVVYAIFDVFSRLVTGIYVGLEGPSWMGAMMALDNMVTDKVEFCKEYGIHITENQWPSKHIPDIIIADRGEFEGFSFEGLINNLNIKIENASPYRGDLKGIVERSFRTLNTKLKHKTPGAIQKEYRKRGDRDYRLDATLTLKSFTQIYINLILNHNSKIIEKYPMEKEMLRDNSIPCPVELWNWGIENKKGRLRVIERDIMRLNLLPRAKASVTRAGIKFRGLHYGAQKSIDEQWYVKSRKSNLDIFYDPRRVNNIYIPNEDGKTFETCYLLEPSLQYKDCILEEIIYNFELVSELKKMHQRQQNQYIVNVDEEIEKIIKEAQKQKRNNDINIESDRKKIQGIKKNRAIEKELNRENEAFSFDNEEKKVVKTTEVISLHKIDEPKAENQDNDTGDNRIMNMLRKKRDEKGGK